MPTFDRETYLRIVRSEAPGPADSLARLALGAAALPYRIGVGLRNAGYDRGRKPITKADVPVISIGNLTLGGTGKTPAVEWVARFARSRGVRVTLLSRGYGQSDGLNDEGLVLDQNLPDVPHLQGKDRVELARIAVEELEAQLLVLDDGFQHRRLARDLDIVLLDALDPFGQGRLFPRGLLREPIGSLRRADLVVLSRADLVGRDRRLEIRANAERRAGRLKWAEARHAPLDLVDEAGRSEPLSDLAGNRVAAFCGIGNPEGFRRTMEGLGVEVLGFRKYPDHHPYTASDVAELSRWVESLNASLALTTQKDSVKLRLGSLGGTPLRALRIGLGFSVGQELVEDAVSAVLPR